MSEDTLCLASKDDARPKKWRKEKSIGRRKKKEITRDEC